MQIGRWSLFLVLISALLLWNSVESIRFDLQSGQTKCIAEEIKMGSMTLGNYHIVNPDEDCPLPDSHNITVGVTSMYGTTYYHEDGVTQGQFAFQAMEEGDYLACFLAAVNKPSATVTVEFDWKSGVYTTIGQESRRKSMELELKKMYANVQSIHDELFYLLEREEEREKLNRSTNSKIAGLSFLSLFICLYVSGLQLWHLKSFFEKQKLL